MAVIPVFVSSTFKDFHPERDALRSRVIPALNEMLAPYGASVVFLDLRWGVDTTTALHEAEAEARVLGVCMREIQRTRPLFLGLIGDRYGWIPAVLPDAGMADPVRNTSGLSVTAWECLTGGLAGDSASVFAFRTLQGQPPSDWVDADTTRIGRLRDRIEAAVGASGGRLSLFAYHLTMVSPDDPQPDITQFVESVTRALAPLVGRRVADAVAHQSPYKAAVRLHTDLRTSTFVGRESELKAVERQLESSGAVAVVGRSGVGKTSLLIKMGATHEYKGWNVVSVLVGAGPQSTSTTEVLRLLLDQTGTGYDPAADAETLLRIWQRVLLGLSPRSLVIIDGLDRLAPGPDRDGLAVVAALPGPGGARMLLSSTLDDQARLLQSRGIEVVSLECFDAEHVPEVVRSHLNVVGRALPSPAMECLANAPRSGIWIQMAVDELDWLTYQDFLAAEDMARTGHDAGLALASVVTDAASRLPESDSALAQGLVKRAAFELGDGVEASNFLLALALARAGLPLEDLAALAGTSQLAASRARWSLGAQVGVVGDDSRLVPTHQVLRRAVLELFPGDHGAVHAAIADRLAARPAIGWDTGDTAGLDRVWHALQSADPSRVLASLSAAWMACEHQLDGKERESLQTQVASVLATALSQPGSADTCLGVLEQVVNGARSDDRAATAFLARASNVDIPLALDLRERLAALSARNTRSQRVKGPRGLFRRLRRAVVLDRSEMLAMTDQSIALQLQARAQLESGAIGQADVLAGKALGIAEELARTEPPQQVLQRELGDALLLMARVKLAALDMSSAESLLQRASQVRIALFEATGSDLDAGRLAGLQVQYAAWACAVGRPAWACEASQQAVATYRRLASGKPSVSSEIKDLSVALNSLVNASIAAGRTAEAPALADESVHIARTLFHEKRDESSAVALFASLDLQGRTYESSGDLRKALATYKDLREHSTTMMGMFAPTAALRRMEFIAWERILAIYLAARDRNPEVLQAFELLVSLARRNVRLDESAQSRQDLAFAVIRHVNALVLRGMDATVPAAEATERVKALIASGDPRGPAALAELQQLLAGGSAR